MTTLSRSFADAVARPRGWGWAMFGLIVAAFAIRCAYFGNPLTDADEEFYLLIGDRMWHGAVPYLDIWDRKPVGLFLLYAGVRLLGGEGIVQYQVIATLFAGATAIVIAVLARRIAPPWTAIVAGLLYLLSLNSSGGQGGQAPVFYNLPMVLSAWLIVTTLDRSPASIVRRGAAAMLLVGVALQIKYSALGEGVYLGLALSWIGWRAGMRGAQLLGAMTLWAALALAPTALAFGWYAAIGHAQDFVFANFTSIGLRGVYTHRFEDLGKILPKLLPLAIPIALSLTARPWRGADTRATDYRLLAGWAIAALASFLAFGTYFNHYALPLFVPLAILAAAGFAVRRWYSGPMLAVLGIGTLVSVDADEAAHFPLYFGDAIYAAPITQAIATNRGAGCIYVYFGDPIFYHLTHSCLPTRWAFPYHLSLTREQPALGVDALAEVKRILDSRPTVIVDRLLPDGDRSAPADAMLARYLARDYRLVGTYPLRGYATIVWALKR